MGKKKQSPHIRTDDLPHPHGADVHWRSKDNLLPAPHRNSGRQYLTKGDKVVYYGRVGTIVRIKEKRRLTHPYPKALVEFAPNPHREGSKPERTWVRLQSLRPLMRI